MYLCGLNRGGLFASMTECGYSAATDRSAEQTLVVEALRVSEFLSPVTEAGSDRVQVMCVLRAPTLPLFAIERASDVIAGEPLHY